MADSTTTGLPGIGTVSLDDVVSFLRDPTGTPAHRRMQIRRLIAAARRMALTSSLAESDKIMISNGTGANAISLGELARSIDLLGLHVPALIWDDWLPNDYDHQPESLLPSRSASTGFYSYPPTLASPGSTGYAVSAGTTGTLAYVEHTGTPFCAGQSARFKMVFTINSDSIRFFAGATSGIRTDMNVSDPVVHCFGLYGEYDAGPPPSPAALKYITNNGGLLPTFQAAPAGILQTLTWEVQFDYGNGQIISDLNGVQETFSGASLPDSEEPLRICIFITNMKSFDPGTRELALQRMQLFVTL